MNYFPLFARLDSIPCLVVGGGQVAARKVRQLRKAGARVTVNAPELGDELAGLLASQAIKFHAGRFDAELVDRYQLIIAATDDAEVNRAVAAAAAIAQRFCNVVDDRELSSFIVPAIVDRNPLVIAVSSGGHAPVLATRLRQQIDTWLHPSLGRMAEFMGRWRPAVRQRFTTLDTRRRFWQSLLGSDTTRRVLAGDDAAADTAMHRELHNAAATEGEALLVGAGPGDPELLTLKAVRALQEADVVLYDRLVTPAILDLARRDAELIPVGKQGGGPSTPQADINRLLVNHVAAGQRVVRLKGGDPFMFGRGGEEIDALEAAGLRWEVIPGVTAASGCAAAFGLPLTYRNMARSLVFATAQNSDGEPPDWQALAQSQQTLVLYMAVARLKLVSEKLQAAGMSAECPAAIIVDGTTPRQRLVRATLGTLAEAGESAGVKAPAMLIIGEVAALARDCSSASSPVSRDVWLPTLNHTALKGPAG